MWWLATTLILAGLFRLLVEWIDAAAEQNTRQEADRRHLQAELDDQLDDEP